MRKRGPKLARQAGAVVWGVRVMFEFSPDGPGICLPCGFFVLGFPRSLAHQPSPALSHFLTFAFSKARYCGDDL